MDPFHGTSPGSSPEFLMAAGIISVLGVVIIIAIIVFFVRLARVPSQAPTTSARPRSASAAEAQLATMHRANASAEALP